MAPLLTKIKNNLEAALKKNDRMTADTLRFLLAALHNREIEKRGHGEDPALKDEEVIDVFKKEAKKRREAAALYVKGNRSDLAEKENQELAVIQKYLPQAMSAAELEMLVDQVIGELSAKGGSPPEADAPWEHASGGKPAGPKDFGRVMSEVMKRSAGRSDGAAVSAVVKSKLGA